MTRLRYETSGGVPSEGDTFAQLTEYLRLAEEACYTIGHMRKANDDTAAGDGFLAIGKRLEITRHLVTQIAMGKIRLQ